LRKRAVGLVLSLVALCLSIIVLTSFHRNVRSAGRNPSAPNTDDASAFSWLWNTPALADTPPTPSTVTVLTYHNDVARTGQNLEEKILTPANVNFYGFGKLGFLAVDGLVDAEPLYVSNLKVAGHAHNVVFAATEHDSVYAFDADTLAQLWHVTVLGSNETPSDDRNCGQVSPEIGITATPAIAYDGQRGIIYLVAMSKDNAGNYFQRLHALDIATGVEISGSPTTIAARYPNLKGGTSFDPKQYKERASLLLIDGDVYTTWASHCDNGDYTGWIIGYNAATLQQANVLNVTPNGSAGAIWMSGAGPAADETGDIYLLDGNGTFDSTLNSSGFPINGDFGNGFLKLSVDGAKFAVADYFDMHDTDAESRGDIDLGSGGALVLPDLKDAEGNTWQLAVGAGKDHRIYVVNRNSMGKFNTQKDNAIYQVLNRALAGGIWSMPAYFQNTIYFGAVNDSLKAFSVENARLVPKPASQTSAVFAYPGTTPSISANATDDGIVWAVEARGDDAGVLHAYDANDLSNELYNSNQAGMRDAFADNKYITPMIANGKVFVGTRSGVMIFGLLH
jgi:hypothetical protein